MNSLLEPIWIKRWQVLALLGGAGFAIGNILAKVTSALGY